MEQTNKDNMLNTEELNKELPNALPTFCCSNSFFKLVNKLPPNISFPPKISVLLLVAAEIIQYKGNTERMDAIVKIK